VLFQVEKFCNRSSLRSMKDFLYCVYKQQYLELVERQVHPNEDRTLNPGPWTPNPRPPTPNPQPCTLQLELCTLHPAPCTLKPEPRTLDPERSAAGHLSMALECG